MYFGPASRRQNETPAADGGGAAVAELPAATGLESEAGMASAVEEIGAGLGLDTPADDEPADKPAPTPAPAPAATPAPSSAPAATPAPTSAPATGKFTAEKAPDTWTPAAQAKWATVDPEIRAEIAKRENDMFKGLSDYKYDATVAKQLRQFLAPVQHELQARGVQPEVVLANLANAHVQLSNTAIPAEQKLQMATAWLKAYGIDLGKAAAPVADDDGVYVDPQVKSLQGEIETLKSRLNGADTRAAAEVRNQLESQIVAFAKDPANAYFEEVSEDIALLIRGSGGTMPLKEAYDKAIFANPVTRAKEHARIQAETAVQAKKDQDERVAAAKRASGANVKTGGHRGSGTAPEGSMDDTMAATLKDIQSRSK